MRMHAQAEEAQASQLGMCCWELHKEAEQTSSLYVQCSALQRPITCATGAGPVTVIKVGVV